MLAGFAALEDPADLVLLNCAPGETAAACRAARGAGEVVIAMSDAPAAITGGYTLVKAALRRHGQRRFRLLFVDPAAPSETRALAARMALAARRFLGAELSYGGTLARAADQKSLSEIAAASSRWPLPEFAL
jgi:flagellar biosynthesis protein FlhG